jgi:hypothetical protein
VSKSDDHSDLRDFLERLVWARRPNRKLGTLLPPQLIDDLARLARVSDTELFDIAITLAAGYTFTDVQKFSKPIYRGQLIDRLDKVMQPASLLEQQLRNLLTIWWDPVTFVAQKCLCDVLKKSKSLGTESGESELAKFHAIAELLAGQIRLAQIEADRWISATRGRPRGAGKSGIAMDKLIRRLEFAARAAGGTWTLNKNDQSGTLIKALELLREHLPDGFVPSPEKHPYSSYQRVLTRARSDWDNSPLSSELISHLDQK